LIAHAGHVVASKGPSADDTERLRQRLATGLAEMGPALPAAACEALLAFIGLLARWNRVYNLTAVRDPTEMVTRHLLDSLSILPYLQGPSVLDVGTGAGLPGIPLALARPEWRFVLLDSNAKKTRFVTQAIAELHMENVTVIHSRVESYRPGAACDSVVSRAFANLAEMVAATRHLHHPGIRLVAMKGEHPERELRALPPDIEVSLAESICVPGLQAQRHVVCMRPRSGPEQRA
jgi:16S rRNA (guanine527-N7)-methyltransferase